MNKYFQRQVLLIRKETTYGSDIIPTAAAYSIPIINATKPVIDPGLIERGHALHTLSSSKPLVGARYAKIPLRIELFGSGTKDTPPRIAAALQACGFTETIHAGSDVSYQPASSSLGSASIYEYIDGLLYKILGVVGNFKFGFKNGEPIYLDFDMQGLHLADSDASIVTPTYETNWKTPIQALSVSLGFFALTDFVVREFNFDMGVSIINRGDCLSATGYKGFMCGKRKPKGNLIIELPLHSKYDFMTALEGNTETAVDITVGSTTGNKYDIDMPKVNITNYEIDEADNGLAIVNIPFSINLNSADDEVVIKHY
jgi:hypothetical protein